MEKVKTALNINIFFFLLILTAYLSISAFEVLVVLLLVHGIYKLAKGEMSFKGILTVPITIYSIPTIVGNLLYNISMIGRAIEESIFQFLYVLKGSFNFSLKDFERINIFIIFVGVISSIVALIKLYVFGELSPIWGGPFEVGTFFAVFAISSLGMYFYTGKRIYLVLFLYFSVFVFLSARRNSMIGYIFTLGLFLYLYKNHINLKKLFLITILTGLLSALLVGYLYQKDIRFRAMLEVVENPEDKHLDTAFSLRWTLFWQGVEVIKRDFEEGNIVALCVGHGVFPGARLEPKSANGTTYESIIFISEMTSRGLIGLTGIILMMFSYYRFLFSIKNRLLQKDVVVLSVMMPLSVLFAGSIFSAFWDALMPLYFLMFGAGELYFSEIKGRASSWV